MRDGKKNGQGTYTWSDGEKYVGEFKYQRMNGQGTLTYPDGRKFVGEFKLDKKWNGSEYDKDGKTTLKYVNGEKQ